MHRFSPRMLMALFSKAPCNRKPADSAAQRFLCWLFGCCPVKTGAPRERS